MAHFQIDFFSDTLQMGTHMHVILPQKTKRHGFTGQTPSGKLQTLYLLHGMGGDDGIWCRRTAMERYVENTSMAVVMPAGQLGFYTDMRHGGRYWTFLSEELPRVCHDFFPQLSEDPAETFAAGCSMGGYGALKLALLAPERFGRAASFSGALDLALMAKSIEITSFWTDIFGSFDAFQNSENDLLAAAKALAASGKPLPLLTISCGTEDPILPCNQSMREHLMQLGYPITYQALPGGHTWEFWEQQLQAYIGSLLADGCILQQI